MKIWADVFMEMKHAAAFFTARRVLDDLSPTRTLRVTSVAPCECDQLRLIQRGW